METPNMHKVAEDLLAKFAPLVDAVKKLHASREKNSGHGFDHDLAVAQWAYRLSIEEGFSYETAALAWVAGILHSLDHVLPNGIKSVIGSMGIKDLLDLTQISEEQKVVIIKAVQEHSGANGANDSTVKVALMDADKIANLGPTVIIRSGQFRPDIPPCETEYLIGTDVNPASTYPKPTSVLDDLRHNMWWGDQVRNPKYCFRLRSAWKHGEKRIAYLANFIARIREEYADIGLA